MQNRIDVFELRGPLAELLDQFSGEAGRSRFEEFKLWQKGITSNLLKPVTVVPVSEVSRFVVKEHLQAANIGWAGENFKRLFFNKVEENVHAGQLGIYTLIKSSFDPEIMVELGSKGRVIALAHFFQLLEKQAQRQTGPLTARCVDVGYVCAMDSNVWAVRAAWLSFGRSWDIEAYSVGDSREWGAGRQFLSQVA